MRPFINPTPLNKLFQEPGQQETTLNFSFELEVEGAGWMSQKGRISEPKGFTRGQSL